MSLPVETLLERIIDPRYMRQDMNPQGSGPTVYLLRYGEVVCVVRLQAATTHQLKHSVCLAASALRADQIVLQTPGSEHPDPDSDTEVAGLLVAIADLAGRSAFAALPFIRGQRATVWGEPIRNAVSPLEEVAVEALRRRVDVGDVLLQAVDIMAESDCAVEVNDHNLDVAGRSLLNESCPDWVVVLVAAHGDTVRQAAIQRFAIPLLLHSGWDVH